MSSIPLPYPLTSARPEFIRLANRIAGKRRPLNFSWNGQPAQFCFSHLRSVPRGSWCLKMTMAGHALELNLNRLPELAWVSPDLAGIDLQQLPGELACGLIEASLGEIFTALTKAGIDMAITAVEPFSFRHAAEEIIGWSISRGSDTGWMQGYVSGDAAALTHLAGLMERAPVAPSAVEKQVPLPVHVVAGSTWLGLEELKALEIHDVLLADLAAYKARHECTLHVAGSRIGLGRAEGRTFLLKQLTPKTATAMADAATAPTASVNDLEIELTFVVGQTTLTVGELGSLTAGFTFELPTLVGEGVTLCANGKPIGKGELIEVGSHLGVRVTEFSAS